MNHRLAVVVTAMPAGAERHPVVVEAIDAQVLHVHPVPPFGGLEHIRTEEVTNVLSYHFFVVVVYDRTAAVGYEREPVLFSILGAVGVFNDRCQSKKSLSGPVKYSMVPSSPTDRNLFTAADTKDWVNSSA